MKKITYTLITLLLTLGVASAHEYNPTNTNALDELTVDRSSPHYAHIHSQRATTLFRQQIAEGLDNCQLSEWRLERQGISFSASCPGTNVYYHDYRVYMNTMFMHTRVDEL